MKSTCSKVLRRTLGVAGFLIGFGLLSAGVASADDDSPGLLGGVAGLLSPVTNSVAPVTDALAPVTGALAPVTRDVTAVADPVLKPVLKAVGPIVAPVLTPLAPTVDSVTQALSPVLEPLQPVTAPVLTPVARTAQDVPLVPRIAEPLVAQQSTPVDVPPVVQVPDAPWTSPVIVPEVPAVVPSGWVEAVVQPHRISAPDLAPPIEAPQQSLPDVPFALPGTTGSASSSGSAGPAVSDLPVVTGNRAQGESLVVGAGHQVHGSWCYYYGRSHPS